MILPVKLAGVRVKLEVFTTASIILRVGMLEFENVAALKESVELEEGFIIPPTITVIAVADAIDDVMLIVTIFELSKTHGWVMLLTEH